MNAIRQGRDIIRQECEAVGITPGILLDAPRTKTYRALRHTILKRLREETGLSWKEIALFLGYKARPGKQYRRLLAKG